MSTGRPKGKSKDPPCEISYNPTGRQFGCSQHQVFWAASERWPEPVELCPIGRMEKSLEDVWRIGNQRDQLRSYLSAFLAVHNGIKEVRDNATKYLKNGMSHSSGAAGKGTVSNTPPPLSATTQGANVGDGGLSGKSDPAEPRTATPEKAPEDSQDSTWCGKRSPHAPHHWNANVPCHIDCNETGRNCPGVSEAPTPVLISGYADFAVADNKGDADGS